MSKVKSFSVGNGDMFYIKHESDNFTVIDCNLDSVDANRIIREIKEESRNKSIYRFISTHPDEDHILGIKELDESKEILNFYCVDNDAKKEEETESFKHYCKLRDSDKVFYIYKDCSRKWMNESGPDNNGEERGSSGINILWPDLANKDFKDALNTCNNYGNANNISPIIKYSISNGASFMWFGDLEKDYVEKIKDEIDWPEIDIIFAPHHGRSSGALPTEILKKLNPKIIIIGNAPSEDLSYYSNYDTITQNSSGDIYFECNGKEIDVYCTNENYSVNFLENKNKISDDNYLGTLVLKETIKS